MKTPREKYENDPQYNFLVKTLLGMIVQCHFTPSELREAVVLASILYEEKRPTTTSIKLTPHEEANFI